MFFASIRGQQSESVIVLITLIVGVEGIEPGEVSYRSASSTYFVRTALVERFAKFLVNSLAFRTFIESTGTFKAGVRRLSIISHYSCC